MRMMIVTVLAVAGVVCALGLCPCLQERAADVLLGTAAEATNARHPAPIRAVRKVPRGGEGAPGEDPQPAAGPPSEQPAPEPTAQPPAWPDPAPEGSPQAAQGDPAESCRLTPAGIQRGTTPAPNAFALPPTTGPSASPEGVLGRSPC